MGDLTDIRIYQLDHECKPAVQIFTLYSSRQDRVHWQHPGVNHEASPLSIKFLPDKDNNLPPLNKLEHGIRRPIRETEDVRLSAGGSAIFLPFTNLKDRSTWIYRICCEHNPDCSALTKEVNPLDNPQMIIEP